MDDDAGALDVLEELDAEACAQVRAFDEAGQVGDGEGLGVGELADLDDAEVGLQRGEGVVGDLGPGGGEARDQRGLADVGVADEAGVGQQAEFQAVAALFAGAAELVLAGAWWVLVAKCWLPRPPRPPRAMTMVSLGRAKSWISSPVASS